MIDKDDILKRLKKIVSEQLGIDESVIKLESNFINDLEADSLDILELVMAVEDEFEIEISDEAEKTMNTVQATFDYLISTVKDQPADIKSYFEILT